MGKAGSLRAEWEGELMGRSSTCPLLQQALGVSGGRDSARCLRVMGMRIGNRRLSAGQ